MLLVISPNDIKSGYVSVSQDVTSQVFFATANAGFRREVFTEVGDFDITCITGEDIDMSFRVLKTNWKLYRDQTCVVKHQYRSNLYDLLKQWFWYGIGHPIVFMKHEKPGVKIFLPKIRKPQNLDELLTWEPYQRIVTVPYFKTGYIFINSFHLLNMCLFASFFNSYFLIGTFVFAFKFILNNFQYQKPLVSAFYALLRYQISFIFCLGAFWSGLKNGTVALECSFNSTPKIHSKKL